MKKEEIIDFLKDYAEVLKNFELPESDFPLNCRTHMSAGCCRIYTVDNRHVATISVKEGGQTPSMPVCGADLEYTRMFVELANAFMKHKKQSRSTMMEKILQEIRDERERQNLKFGEATFDSDPWMEILVEEVGEVANALIDKWDSEVEKELIQVAAVCVKWIEHLRGESHYRVLEGESNGGR